MALDASEMQERTRRVAWRWRIERARGSNSCRCGGGRRVGGRVVVRASVGRMLLARRGNVGGEKKRSKVQVRQGKALLLLGPNGTSA